MYDSRQGFFLPCIFFNFNDCVNCSKNLEFKIENAFGWVVFIQLSCCKICQLRGIRAFFQFPTLVTFHMITVWLSLPLGKWRVVWHLVQMASIKGSGCAPGGCRDQQDTLSLGGWSSIGASLVLTWGPNPGCPGEMQWLNPAVKPLLRKGGCQESHPLV